MLKYFEIYFNPVITKPYHDINIYIVYTQLERYYKLRMRISFSENRFNINKYTYFSLI